jgi:hypothetical protein
MGLLRKAAVAEGRGEQGGRKPGDQEDPHRRRGPGLLRRSIKVLELIPARQAAVPQAVPTEASPPVEPAAQAALSPSAPPPSQLSIELADGGSVQVPMPVRVEAVPVAREAPRVALPAGPSGDLLEEILTAVSALRAGVELPSRLFTALTSFLGARKAAFLLYDPVRLVYAPWALRGYDQTTLHRMRIPLGANEAWNALANGRPLVVVGAQSLAQFQQFFSSREFASVSRLVLVPFIADEKLVAVFLVTDMDSPFPTEDALVEALSRAAEAGAPRVQEARAARIAAAVSSGSRPEAVFPQDESARFLEAVGASRAKVLLVALSLEEFSKKVLGTHQDLDPFRLHEDLLFFLGSFLADVGRVLPVRQGRFILALPEFDPGVLDVFSHQLALFLHGLLGNGEARDFGVSPRILRSSTWPEDGADLRTLVESLSSS